MDEVKEMLKSDLKLTVVNPKYILNFDHLNHAVFKTLYFSSRQQMKTKSIYTELLFNLSPNKSITDALKTFGVEECDKAALFVIFGAPEKASDKISETVKGTLIRFREIGGVNCIFDIKKLYSVQNHVQEIDDIFRVIVTKMTARDVL